MTTLSDNHKALNLLREDPTRFANQGTVVATWRTYRGRRLGPYCRLTWRENGRQRSIYLGRQSPLVDEVRRLLHEAQTIRRMIRQHRRNMALFRENVIRPLRQYLDEIFRLFGNGLYIKGSDIGGIKTAGPRLTTADVPEHLIPEFPLPLPSFLTEMEPATQREQETHSTHTNPKRKRGQKTPSPNTTLKHSQAPPSTPPLPHVLRTRNHPFDRRPREAFGGEGRGEGAEAKKISTYTTAPHRDPPPYQHGKKRVSKIC
jgi:hypothetical protein